MNDTRKYRLQRFLRRFLFTAVSCFLVLLLLNAVFPLPDKIEYSTIITDDKGEVIHAFLTSDDKWRMKTELHEISPLLQKTIIEKEDRYFYWHPGINPFAIARALVKNVLSFKRTSGASTITMQVARALHPGKRTYTRKLIEMFRAFQLEWKYSKKEILQMYLNLAPYGGNIEGVKAASLLYFKKNPDHLSLAEITALSIIPNRPSSLVIGRDNARIVEQRNRWLKKFAAEKVFTSKQIRDALEEPLTAKRHTVPRYIPHLANRLHQTGSNLIHTFIRMNMQMTIEKIVADYVHALSQKNIHNASVIVIDNTSHEVISYAGSADFNSTADAGQVDGVKAVRQPGSTLKPLLYGLCIDAGLMTPKTVLTDVPVSYEGYAPENFDRQFNGYISMEYALEHSLNIPAVKSLKLLGKDELLYSLAACNFRQIKKDQRKLGLSMILGGCGATLEELTGMYSAIACNGVYHRPQFHTAEPSTKSRKLLSNAASFMITDILSKVNRPDFPLNWQSTERMPKIAWKTGTSYGRRDAWSIGYNKHYTVGVWVGNFSAKGVQELSGANTATPLLFRIFNIIDYDSDESWYTRPADCDTRLVCSETGLLPEDHCTHIVSDYFIPLISSMEHCSNRKEIMISADGRFSYCKACLPVNGYRKKEYRIIPPEMQRYYEERKIAYDKIPPHNPACEKIFHEGGPSIISPRSGSEYLISRRHPEPLQLSCSAGNDVGRIYWYINNQYYKSTDIHTKQYFVPEEGPVKISCTDDKGRNRDIWIRVRYVEM